MPKANPDCRDRRSIALCAGQVSKIKAIASRTRSTEAAAIRLLIDRGFEAIEATGI